jgi:DNA-binding NarL/FixJ family response regulator
VGCKICWTPTVSSSSARREPPARHSVGSDALDPDVAVLDVQLPDGDGVSVSREVRSRHPRTACLILTSFADDEALFNAIMAGAAGYVLKQIRGNDLVDAVRKVAAGHSLLDSAATARVVERLRRGPRWMSGSLTSPNRSNACSN